MSARAAPPTGVGGGPLWPRRGLALLIGLTCHAVFGLAVAWMFIGLRDGLGRRGHPFGIAQAVLDVALALQFPFVHSLLLTGAGQRWLARVAGRHGRTLRPTLYAGIASIQILATFALWAPSGVVLWRAHGASLVPAHALYALAWVFLAKALIDGGLGLQTGWIGWTSLWRGVAPAFAPLATGGLFARCRQPIYLGFLLTLWTGPTWTPDRIGLALVWSAYCVLGPLHKERRYLERHGDRFWAYQRQVPFMVPRFRSRFRREL